MLRFVFYSFELDHLSVYFYNNAHKMDCSVYLFSFSLSSLTIPEKSSFPGFQNQKENFPYSPIFLQPPTSVKHAHHVHAART